MVAASSAKALGAPPERRCPLRYERMTGPTAALSVAPFLVLLVSALPAPAVYSALPQSAPVADDRSLHLVFYAHAFESREAFDAEVDFLVQALRSVEPWASHEFIRTHRVFGENPEVAHVVTEDRPHPALRIRPAINDELRPLGLARFKLVFLSRERFLSWANVTRGWEPSVVTLSVPPDRGAEEREFTGRVFLHELGHSFGLRDEMERGVIALAGSEGTLPGPPNCAPDHATAEAWWGGMVGQDPRVGYYSGCAGNPAYVRPTRTSLMNLADLASSPQDYGPVSERYLRIVLAEWFTP